MAVAIASFKVQSDIYLEVLRKTDTISQYTLGSGLYSRKELFE
jgi:hypothetical protein